MSKNTVRRACNRVRYNLVQLEEAFENIENKTKNQAETIKRKDKEIERLKAKDVEIVRCKDCIHRKPLESMYSIGFNDKVVVRWRCQYMFENQDDDFCSYGERIEE